MTKALPHKKSDGASARSLIAAAADGDASEVARLLASGSAPDARAVAGGETALMRATARGHETVARLLLDAGADASARRADGFTPLILAVFFGHERVARLLVERGADARARTSLGTTAARWAASRGFGEMASLLRVAEASSPQVAVAVVAAPASDEVSIFSRKTEPRDSRAAASAGTVATS